MNKTIHPSKAQLAALQQLPQDQPIIMINLLKFKDKVEDSEETGIEAYQKYGELVAPFFQKAGGKIIFSGIPTAMVIGPEEDKFAEWDDILLVEYPNVPAFLGMISQPDYPHPARTRALEDSRLILSSKASSKL